MTLKEIKAEIEAGACKNGREDEWCCQRRRWADALKAERERIEGFHWQQQTCAHCKHCPGCGDKLPLQVGCMNCGREP